MEPVPAGSKTDPLLAKAERWWWRLWDNIIKTTTPTHTPLHTHPCLMAFTARERSGNSADPTVSAEGGVGGAPGTGAEVPLQPVEQPMVRQAVPLQPM